MSFEEVIREVASNGLVADAVGREEEWVKERLDSHKNMSVPTEIHREDGRSFIVHDQKLPDGSISSVAIENTHLKAMERQLRQSQRMEAIGQLTGGIAHDFNNLLGIMMGNAEMLEMNVNLDDLSRQNITGIINATERAAALTARLLAFSRQQNLAPAISNVNVLIANIEDLLNRTLGETVSLQIGHQLNIWSVMVDQSQFENAIINLAINARDAMPGGGVIDIDFLNITVRAAELRKYTGIEAGDYVMITVADTGQGIAKDVIGKVFEPFFTTKEVGKGSGLGLSMVHGFVQQSNGHITIESEVGQGTTVSIFLRRNKKENTSKNPLGNPVKSHEGTERILVVEDDKSLKSIPVRALKKMGYEVDEAENSDEALKLLNDQPPYDLLFTDIVLPGEMNGIELAEVFMSADPAIKIIYTTGYADDVATSDQLMQINDKLLRKPYHLRQLREKIRSALDERTT